MSAVRCAHLAKGAKPALCDGCAVQVAIAFATYEEEREKLGAWAKEAKSKLLAGGQVSLRRFCSYCASDDFATEEEQRAHAATCDKHPAVARAATAEARVAEQERVLRSSVPEHFKGATSPVGAVQGYIAELERRVAVAECGAPRRAPLQEHACLPCEQHGHCHVCEQDHAPVHALAWSGVAGLGRTPVAACGAQSPYGALLSIEPARATCDACRALNEGGAP